MGNKQSFWSKNNGRNLAILIIVIAISPYLVLAGFIGMIFMTYTPPDTYDFSIYSGHVTKVEIVDWINTSEHLSQDPAENYRVILALDESQIPGLLSELSGVEFHRSSPESGDGFVGRCFLFTLDDGSYRVIGRYGYARFKLEDDELDRYTRTYAYIQDYDFDDLFAPYLGR